MVDFESIAENFSLIYFFSSVILLLGLFFLVFPLLLRLIYTRKIKTFDVKTFFFVTTIVLLVVSSSQLVYYSSEHPKILLPFVLLSCALKFGSPAMMVKKMRQKEQDSEKWQRKKKLLFLVSLVAAIYIIISTLSSGKELNIVETLMTTFASAYGFSRIYLETLFKYRKSSEQKGAWFHWLAGFFIGVAFIVLIPFLVPDYTMIFKLSGGIGWLGAFSYLFFVEEHSEDLAEDSGEDGEGQESYEPDSECERAKGTSDSTQPDHVSLQRKKVSLQRKTLSLQRKKIAIDQPLARDSPSADFSQDTKKPTIRRSKIPLSRFSRKKL